MRFLAPFLFLCLTGSLASAADPRAATEPNSAPSESSAANIEKSAKINTRQDPSQDLGQGNHEDSEGGESNERPSSEELDIPSDNPAEIQLNAPVIVTDGHVQEDSGSSDKIHDDDRVTPAGRLDNEYVSFAEEEEFDSVRRELQAEIRFDGNVDFRRDRDDWDGHFDRDDRRDRDRDDSFSSPSSSVPYIGLSINPRSSLVYIATGSDRLLTCNPSLRNCQTSNLRLRRGQGDRDQTLLTSSLAVDAYGGRRDSPRFSAVRFTGRSRRLENQIQTVVYSREFDKILYRSFAASARRFPFNTQVLINSDTSSLFYLVQAYNALVALDHIHPRDRIIQRKVEFYDRNNPATCIAIDESKDTLFVGFSQGQIIAIDASTLKRKYALPTQRRARPRRMIVDPQHRSLYVLYDHYYTGDRSRKNYILEYNLSERKVSSKIVFADSYQMLDFRVNGHNKKVYILVSPWGRNTFTFVLLGRRGEEVKTMKLGYFPTHWEVNISQDSRSYGCIYATGRKRGSYHVKRYCIDS